MSYDISNYNCLENVHSKNRNRTYFLITENLEILVNYFIPANAKPPPVLNSVSAVMILVTGGAHCVPLT